MWVSLGLGVVYLKFVSGWKIRKSYLVVLGAVAALFIVLFGTHTYDELMGSGYYRAYVVKESFAIWQTHPWFGLGSGTYGGVVSVMFDSPIYQDYGFDPRWLNYGIKTFHSLDTFWPQIMVELGLVGTLLFIAFLFGLIRLALRESARSTNEFRARILRGFSAIPVVLMLMLIGGGLNLTSFLLTYTILFGLFLGMKDEPVAPTVTLNENTAHQ